MEEFRGNSPVEITSDTGLSLLLKSIKILINENATKEKKYREQRKVSNKT